MPEVDTKFRGDSEKSKDIRQTNIIAARAVADVVRTSLGPKGMDKMVSLNFSIARTLSARYFFLKILGTLRGYLRRFRDILRVADDDKVYVFMWVTPLGSSLYERLFRERLFNPEMS